jgi:hypothetical protein
MSYPTPIGDQLLEEYRCQDRGGPDGQRCQLLIEHDPPLISDLELSLGQLRFGIALHVALVAHPSDPGSWPAGSGFDTRVARLAMRSPLEIWLIMSGSASLGLAAMATRWSAVRRKLWQDESDVASAKAERERARFEEAYYASLRRAIEDSEGAVEQLLAYGTFAPGVLEVRAQQVAKLLSRTDVIDFRDELPPDDTAGSS